VVDFLRVWIEAVDGSYRPTVAADPKQPVTMPEQIVRPEFDPDPTVEEYIERVLVRYDVARTDGVLVGYLYAATPPADDALAKLAGAR